MARVRRAIGKNRGVAILLALFFMILLSLIGIALIGMVPVELRSSTRTKLDLQAHYAVTSGVRHARAWCSAVMTPSIEPTKPDYLGDSAATTGNSFYSGGTGYFNDITGVNGAVPEVEYTPMQLEDVYGSGLIPTNTSKWGGVYKMLNIPDTGTTSVHEKTVVLVKKAPITLGQWTVYTVIIPDADSPGGVNTLDAGQTKIVTFFGGAGKAGRRCYQIVALAFYQGFPTLRAKSTILEDSFARYSLFVDQDPTHSWVMQGSPGQTTTLGPVHSNIPFHFAINPSVWTQPAGSVVPFNGLLSFGRNATYTDDKVDEAHNADGNLYSEGNDERGSNAANRPFNDSNAEYGDRYSKIIAGGKSNLRKVSPVALPPDSSKIANAAYGTGFDTSPYTGGAVSGHIAPGGEPDGIFVYPGSTGKAAGGIVVKGDQKEMFLDVVNSNGRPLGVDSVSGSTVVATATDVSQLESGTASGNPGIRVQSKKAVTTTTVVTNTSISTSVKRATTRIVVSTTGSSVRTLTSTTRVSVSTGRSTGTTIGTTTRRTSSSTGVTVRTTINTTTLSGTVVNTTINTTRNTTTNYGTSTIRNTVTNTTRFTTLNRITTTTGTSYTTVGGAGGIVQTIYLSTVITNTTINTSTNLTTQTTLFSSSTGQVVGTTLGTTRNTVSSSTGITVRTTLNTSTLMGTVTITSTTTRYNRTTLYSTTTITNFPITTRYLTTRIRTTIPATTSLVTRLITTVGSVTFNPIDQLIEAKNVSVNLNPTMFQANGTNNYVRPAGAKGSGADMNVSKLSGITQLLLSSGGALTPLGATSVAPGNVVIIKQSRMDPTKAIVFIVPANAAADGALLNGAVYHEGNVGDATSGGIAGVNFGRKTIGGQVPPASGSTQVATNSPDLFGQQPLKAAAIQGIANNLWQFGTRRNETDTAKLHADNGLGLVAENVHINASPNDFTNFQDAHPPNYADSGGDNMLNIHAVILGGSSQAGGLTVKGFTDINSITPGNLGSSAFQMPLARFVGGLILHNYYARVNGITGAGWNSQNIYNQQLALKPPPFFPNNGLLLPLSYVEERIWADQQL